MRLSSILIPFLSVGALAQQTQTYVEPKSNITFQALVNPSSITFGIALPTTAGSKDFIGTVAGKGAGWAGISLGGAMTNTLLLTVWPNGQSLMASFRKTR
jgi:hypothetical protein